MDKIDCMGTGLRETVIFQVHPDEVAYEIQLAKKFCEQLGFLPKPAIEKYASKGGVIRGEQNGQPCGMVVADHQVISTPGTTRIYQAAIEMQAQRRSHGLHLVRQICRDGVAKGNHTATAWCLQNLDANLFWKQAGFTAVGKVTAGMKRDGTLIGWACPLDGREITDSDRKTTEALMRRIRRVKRELVALHQRQLFPDLDLR